MMSTRSLSLVLAAVMLVLVPSQARAQGRDAQARSLVRDALEEYQSLEVDRAISRLRMALNACGRNNCSPATLAKVHMAMGVVLVGGQNDSAAGTNSFVEALRLDP